MYGLLSISNKRSPCCTSAPSLKWTAVNSPAICDFTCTTSDASTVPTAVSCIGTDCFVATATLTGAGGMDGGPAGFDAVSAVWDEHPVKTHTSTANVSMDMT